MREWLCNIIFRTAKTAPAVERAFEDELEFKVNSIKKRIAAIRSNIGRSAQPNQTSQTQTKFMVEPEERSKRNNVQTSNQKQEQNNKAEELKRKLMGLK
jgi:hypothetical protein